MDTKILEIRDSGTFIGALAIRMKGDNDTQDVLFSPSGLIPPTDQALCS